MRHSENCPVGSRAAPGQHNGNLGCCACRPCGHGDCPSVRRARWSLAIATAAAGSMMAGLILGTKWEIPWLVPLGYAIGLPLAGVAVRWAPRRWSGYRIHL